MNKTVRIKRKNKTKWLVEWRTPKGDFVRVACRSLAEASELAHQAEAYN